VNDGKPDRDANPYARQILDRQIDLIRGAHPDIAFTGLDGSSPRRPGEDFGFAFRENRLLVRPDLAEQVVDFLRGRGTDLAVLPTGALPGDHPTAGRSDVAGEDLDRRDGLEGRLPVVLHLQNCEPVRTVSELSRLIQATFSADADGFPAASPHHAFFMAPHGPLCPATEPEEVGREDRVYPAMRREGSGEGSTVAVLDTGFVRSAAGHFHWLRGVSRWDPDRLDRFDVTHLTAEPDGFIDPYAGHGTFIAGVIGRIAPAADVHVRRLDIDLRTIFNGWPTYAADIVDELHLPDHIRMALWQGRKVISVSAGGPTLDDQPPLSMLGIRTLLERDEAVLVTAAGNESSAQPFWPAAFEWVTGVGALDAAGTGVAGYSNTGVNADVYAPGTDLVNAFACGRYECFQPPDAGTVRNFHGLARWSGTSFATPVVAGLVAARMAAQAQTAPAALAALLTVAGTSHVVAGAGPTLMPEYGDLGI
jgi:subtilisin family serine protease